MPQTVPKSPMKGVAAAVVASHGSQFSRRVSSAVEPICNDRRTASRLRMSGLPGFSLTVAWLDLAVARLKHFRQRAARQIRARRTDFRQFFTLAEYVQELSGFTDCTLKNTRLVEYDGPGKNGEKKQDQQNKACDKTGVRQVLPNITLKKNE